MKTIITILLIIAIIPSAAKSSNKARIDSLKAELAGAKGDSNHVKLLNDLCASYNNIDPNVGMKYGEEAVELAKKINWQEGLALTFNSLGENNWRRSDYPNALRYFEKALKINEESENKLGVAGNLGNMGLIYRVQSDYEKALEYYGKSLEILEELDNKKDIPRLLGNIGVIYMVQKDYEKAQEYYLRALKINEELGRKSSIASNLGNIGLLYHYQLDYGNAMKYFMDALKITEELNDKRAIATNLGNIGGLYLDVFIDSVEIKKSDLNDLISLNKKVNLEKSIEYTRRAIDIYGELGDINSRSVFLGNLADAFNLKGDYKRESAALREHQRLKDSVFSNEKQKEINEISAERDRIEQQRIEAEEEAVLKEKIAYRNTLQYLGLGAVVVFFAVLMLLQGKMRFREYVARALVFITFILLFEFILVLIDPFTDEWSEGEPVIKFMMNLLLALVIFPMHQFFERRVTKTLLLRGYGSSIEKVLEEFRKKGVAKME